MKNKTLLRNTKNLKQLAALLGYKPQSLAYLIYKLPESEKYKKFEIPKKNGQTRIIMAPDERLKSLQKKLTNLLYQVIEERRTGDLSVESYKGINKMVPKRDRAKYIISHGFEKGLSIKSNAERHIRKRFVLNIDLKDFYGSINFGRVRGFFINNNNFKLDKKISTILAQIACHENKLPQGSPCSPIIANLICSYLDSALFKICKQYNCTYTRYADDISISSNSKWFPKEIASKKFFANAYKPSKKLINIIQKFGFEINKTKFRMHHKSSRQMVTGLVTNSHVNVPSEYYRMTRSMCNSLFSSDQYYVKKPLQRIQKNNIVFLIRNLFRKNPHKKHYEIRPTDSLNIIEGRLNYIYEVKKYKNKYATREYRTIKPITPVKSDKDIKFPPPNRSHDFSHESHTVAIDGIRNLYQYFLFYKYFYRNEQPMIICEGKTDLVYIKCAIIQLQNQYPNLFKDNKFQVSFLSRTRRKNELMSLAEGTGGLIYIIDIYKKMFKKFKSTRTLKPVIIIADNDTDGRKVLSRAKGKSNNQSNSNIINYYKNLHVMLIPLLTGQKETYIENYFPSKVLHTKLGGKSFTTSNSFDSSKFYGKNIFAENVIKDNQSNINFDKFKPLLNQLSKIILDYHNTP